MGEVKQEKFRAVIGVDFSEACEHAIHEAMRLARRMPRVELHFVHVLEVSPNLHDARLLDELSDNLEEAMARLERHVRDTLYGERGDAGWGIDLAYHVRVGPVARELHQVAVDVDAELLIIGKSEPRVLRKLFRKSPTRELVRIARVPVVVARPKDYRGLHKSPQPDPARPGQDLTQSGSFATVDYYEASRSTHISGMI